MIVKEKILSWIKTKQKSYYSRYKVAKKYFKDNDYYHGVNNGHGSGYFDCLNDLEQHLTGIKKIGTDKISFQEVVQANTHILEKHI